MSSLSWAYRTRMLIVVCGRAVILWRVTRGDGRGWYWRPAELTGGQCRIGPFGSMASARADAERLRGLPGGD